MLLGRRIALLLILHLTMGCNHLFYQPLKTVVETPSAVRASYDEFSLDSSDGEKIFMWHIKAKTPKRGAVLHFHGNGENMSTHYHFCAWLTEQGFDVYTFDYRGYGKSSGKPNRLGTHHDGMAAIDYVSKHENDFYIFAQSLGTAVSIPAIAKLQPKNLNAIILESAIASYRRTARLLVSQSFLLWPIQYPLSFLISDELSPEDYAKDIHYPVLAIHGDQDIVVAFEEGERLYDLLASKDKEFWRLRGGWHTPTFIDNDSPFRPRLVDFLCLKAKSPVACRSKAPALPVAH